MKTKQAYQTTVALAIARLQIISNVSNSFTLKKVA